MEKKETLNTCAGFTLIELSVVLVIIGLVVGGVLAGQELIHNAGMRATISQIEKFNTAANTFRDKYGYLPGDIKDPDASSFGFLARGPYAGQGDGNGVIDGFGAAAGSHDGYIVTDGEPLLFWSDLTKAHFIEGGSIDTNYGYIPVGNANQTPDNFYPAAKIGRGNYIYVWSGGPTLGINDLNNNSTNYFAISSVSSIYFYTLYSTPGLTVQEASQIDTKMDDGLPQLGRVTALYLNTAANAWWAGTGGTVTGAPYTTATIGSSTTCFDNGNVAGKMQQYSLEISNGSNVNCALSFSFQ